MSIFAGVPSVACECQRCGSPFTVFKLRRVRKDGRVRWNLPPISKRRTCPACRTGRRNGQG